MSLAEHQTRIRARGFDIAPDGVYGPATDRALKAVLDMLDRYSPPPVAPTLSVEAFFAGFIGDHEGELSLHPKDNGNWSGGKAGAGTLIGSKYGVTGAALAAYRGKPVTAADMAALTKAEAVALGIQNYYRAPGFDRLPWNRVTASVVDKGWGSGPGQAIKLLQRVVGVTDDGKLGPATVAAYKNWLERVSEEEAARVWGDRRMAFDTSLKQPTFLAGWNNRTRSFLPGTPWWRAWA